ncbi:MAG: hypothetical protein ACYDB7_10855 [Mycobacteriales bacterium]
MARIDLDPVPAEKLTSLHATLPKVAEVIEVALDWIEADPVDPRAKRRRFSNGMRAIVRPAADADWLILWEEDPPGQPVVRFIGETASL